jgi:hypothetical protein
VHAEDPGNEDQHAGKDPGPPEEHSRTPPKSNGHGVPPSDGLEPSTGLMLA